MDKATKRSGGGWSFRTGMPGSGGGFSFREWGVVLPLALAVAGWFLVLRAVAETQDFRWFGDLVVGHDFAQHHAAGILWRDGGPGAVYAPGAIGRAIGEIHGDARSTRLFAEAGYLYPPPVAWLASLICPEEYRLAVFGFWGLTAVVAVLSVLAAARFFSRGSGPRWVVLVWGLTFPSFLAAFLYGQPSSFALLAVVGAGWASGRGRPWLAGIFLAILAAKPTWLIALLPVLWLAGFRRETLAAVVVTLGGGLLSLWLLGGWKAHADWVAVVTDHSHNRGSWMLSGSIPGLMASLLDRSPGWLAWAVWTLALGGIFLLRRQLFPCSTSPSQRWAMALGVAALGSPYLLHYDLVFLIPLMMAAGEGPGRWLLWTAAGAGFLGPDFGLPLAPVLGIAGVWSVAGRADFRESLPTGT